MNKKKRLWWGREITGNYWKFGQREGKQHKNKPFDKGYMLEKDKTHTFFFFINI